MEETRTFRGKLSLDEDEESGYGIHIHQGENADLIGYLDELAERHEGKNCEIDVFVRIEENIQNPPELITHPGRSRILPIVANVVTITAKPNPLVWQEEDYSGELSFLEEFENGRDE